jgi:hypothetical protein
VEWRYSSTILNLGWVVSFTHLQLCFWENSPRYSQSDCGSQSRSGRCSQKSPAPTGNWTPTPRSSIIIFTFARKYTIIMFYFCFFIYLCSLCNWPLGCYVCT